jgi:rod shape-determining protein MreD
MIARALRPMSPALWIGAPMVASMVASLVLAVPLRVAGFQAPEPVFALVPAFSWALARPSITPPFALVALGLFLDLLWGGPLGYWPLCLLAAYTLIFSARRILSGQEFLALWGAYALACAAAEISGLALAVLHSGRAPGLAGAGLQFVATAALFPFAWRLIERYEAADARFR